MPPTPETDHSTPEGRRTPCRTWRPRGMGPTGRASPRQRRWRTPCRTWPGAGSPCRMPSTPSLAVPAPVMAGSLPQYRTAGPEGYTQSGRAVPAAWPPSGAGEAARSGATAPEGQRAARQQQPGANAGQAARAVARSSARRPVQRGRGTRMAPGGAPRLAAGAGRAPGACRRRQDRGEPTNRLAVPIGPTRVAAPVVRSIENRSEADPPARGERCEGTVPIRRDVEPSPGGHVDAELPDRVEHAVVGRVPGARTSRPNDHEEGRRWAPATLRV